MNTTLLHSIKSTLVLGFTLLCSLWAVPGSAATPTVLASGVGNPGNLLVDGVSVYWIDNLTGEIKSVSKTPGGTVTTLGVVASGINDFVQDTAFIYYRVNSGGFAIGKVSKSGATTTRFGVDNYPLVAGSALAIGPAGGVLYYDSDRDVPNDGVDAFLGMASISSLGGADQVLMYQDPGYAGLLNGDNSSGEAALQLDGLPYAPFGGAPGASSTDSTYLYWADGSYQNAIWQMPLVGGPPAAIVSGRTGIRFIATPTTGAAAGSIFWIEGNVGAGRLMRREVGGQIITVVSNVISSANRCFAVDNDQVFCEQGGSVVQVSINGGPVTVVSSVVQVFGPVGLGLDANYIYCGNLTGQILRIPRGTTGGTTYTITVDASPVAGGTVSGGGTFAAGTSRTVSATARPGYTFANWTENGGVVSSAGNYIFTLNGSRNLVANFTQNPVSYTIVVSASPAAGGTVGGGGTFAGGSFQTVTATAQSGYTFTNWTENGSVVSSSPTYGFTLNASRNLVANFKPITHAITVSASPPTEGSVSGAGTFNAGSSRTVTATALPGYMFTNWMEGGAVVSTAASYTFVLNADRVLVANFLPRTTVTYTIEVAAAPAAGGSAGGGGTYPAGTSRTVTAVTNAGYAFANWTENGRVVSASPSYTFLLTANRNLTANFSLITRTISLHAAPATGGAVAGGGIFAAGSSQTVSATPNPNYTFTNWTENGSVVSASANYTFTLNANRNLVANFKIITYAIAVSAAPAVGGVVSGGGLFNAGTTRTVSAAAKPGYTFANWMEGGSVVSTNAAYTFALNGNRTLVAGFVPIPKYTIAVSAAPGAGGSVSGGGIFLAGTPHTVRATSNTGYAFVNWTENGAVVSAAPGYTFTLTGNRTLVANFIPKSSVTYTIALGAAPSDGGVTAGDGTYPAGTFQTVTATAYTGHTFVDWTEGGRVVSAAADYTFLLTANRNLTANFKMITNTLVVRASPAAGGTVSGGGNFAQGSVQTVTATANYGYTFTNWTDGGNIVSAAATYAFALTGNQTLVANFTKNSPQQNLIGTWSGTWSGQSVGPSWAGTNSTPVAGTWILDIQTVDLTNNTAAGTLTWNGTDAYWTYTIDGTGNITSATPEPFIPDRTISFDATNTTLTVEGSGQFRLTVDGTAGAANPSDAFYGPTFGVTINPVVGTITTQGNGFEAHPYDPANFNTGISSGTVTGARTAGP